MKLTQAEERHLMDLVLSGTDRAQAETPRLVECGLAIAGKARFGTWAKATAKGAALTKTWSPAKQLELMTVNDAQTQPSRGAVPRQHRTTAKQAGAPNHTPTPAVATSPTAPLHTETTLMPPAPASKPGSPSPARLRSPALEQVAPNAVRVTLGSKVTYYPLASLDSIQNADKQVCRTANRFFRPYPVEASSADEVVPR